MQARRDELEEATQTRVRSIADPSQTSDPAYLDGLRAALIAALDYAIEVIGSEGLASPPPIPAALLVQTRLAAQAGVTLGTVLRRYFAGYTLLGDFIVEELAQGEVLTAAESKDLLRTGAVLFDRLVEAISEEHARASGDQRRTSEQRRAERIERLLAGELVETADLGYDFTGHHVGVIATGLGATDAVVSLAAKLDCQRLIVPRDDRTVWAWFGTRDRTDAAKIENLVADYWPAGSSLAIGESSRGLAGWRLTHQQARATVPVIERSPKSSTRYADVALVASMLRDELLATSLREIYLDPLTDERDGGEALRETLRAYFFAGHNVSSAAAALGVSRRTVTNRLRTVEVKIGRSLGPIAVELDAVLRLQELVTE